jgi:hypothetical protein
MKPSPTALDQARHLQLLVDSLIGGHTWGPAARTDARLLVDRLCGHCGDVERAEAQERSLRARAAARRRAA